MSYRLVYIVTVGDEKKFDDSKTRRLQGMRAIQFSARLQACTGKKICGPDIPSQNMYLVMFRDFAATDPDNPLAPAKMVEADKARVELLQRFVASQPHHTVIIAHVSLVRALDCADARSHHLYEVRIEDGKIADLTEVDIEAMIRELELTPEGAREAAGK